MQLNIFINRVKAIYPFLQTCIKIYFLRKTLAENIILDYQNVAIYMIISAFTLSLKKGKEQILNH